MFLSPCQVAVDFLYDCIQIFYELFSFADDFLPVLEHLQIPNFKRILKCRIMIHIFEKFISLVHDMIISSQICKIDLIQLAEFKVHKPASFPRTILDNI